MNPEWCLRYRATIIARLEFERFPPLVAEEATDLALEQIEERVRTRDWKFNGEKHFRNVWLHRAGLRALDLHRRNRRRLPARSAGLSHEWLVVYQDCLSRLSSAHQRILELTFVEDLTDREIGQTLWPDEPANRAARRAYFERHDAQGALRCELILAGLDAQTLDFQYGPFGRLRMRHRELS